MVVSTPEPFIATMTPARRFYPLQNGTILFEVPLNGNHPFKDEPKFTFEIAFGEGQILDGEPVIPALAQICQFVEGVIDIVETHILN